MQVLQDWLEKGKFLHLGSNKIFYLDLGEKNANPNATLLLLHGFPESSFSFHKVIDSLLEQFDRVVLFDMLGFGLSDKPNDATYYSILSHAQTATALWKTLEVKGGHLISHDMGDSVATEILSLQEEGVFQKSVPEGIQSFSFTNGSMVLQYADLRIAQKILLKPVIGPIFSNLLIYPIFKKQILSAHGVNNLSSEDLVALWENIKYNKGRSKAHLIIRYYLDRIKYEKSRWLPMLKKTNTPIHICWADQDQVARIEMAYFLKKNICPEAHLSLILGGGHFCQIGSPNKWIDKVIPFYTDTLLKMNT